MKENHNRRWPSFSEDEIQAVVQVLRSGRVNYWTGEEGKLFEKEFADYCQRKYAIALANGTAALEVALESLGLGNGDEIIVTSRTFMASASAVVRCGGTPVFADVDMESQNITAKTIEAVLTAKTKGIIAVHLAGWSCEMDEILDLSKKNGIYVIEDCAQALGGRYKGKPVGSFGDFAAFSFCQDKIITTGGEGGMLVTNSHELWQKAWALKDHGKNPTKVFRKDHPPGFRWLHDSFGSNFRMTEMQSAIGRIALEKLDAMVEHRRNNAVFLDNFFERFPLFRVVRPPDYIYHAYYKYYVFINRDHLKQGWDRDRIIQEICEKGIACFSGSCSEVYQEEAFRNTEFRPKSRLPVAKQLGETSLMFLVDPTITPGMFEESLETFNVIFTKSQK